MLSYEQPNTRVHSGKLSTNPVNQGTALVCPLKLVMGKNNLERKHC